jgi:transposase-like protein
MRKAIIVFLVLTVAVLSFVSCKFDDVHYCPRCGSTNIKEDGKEVSDGKKFQRYQCRGCGWSFLILEGNVL